MVLCELVEPFLAAACTAPTHCSRRLAAYLGRVEDSYGDRPYHNLHHAAQVVATAARIWTELGLGAAVQAANAKDSDVLAVAYIVAACVHDADHQGLTNDFLIRSNHPFAIDANDISPNESHHCAFAFRLLLAEGGAYNFISRLEPAAFWTFRRHVLGMVMSTDMGRHHEVVRDLRARDLTAPRACDVPLLLQAAIKIADVGHTVLPTPDHLPWAHRLQQELLLEGQAWARRGWRAPSAMEGGDLALAQIAFFRLVVVPLLEAFTLALPAAGVLLEAARRNEGAWRASPL